MGEPTVFNFVKSGDTREKQRFIAVSDSTAAFKFTPSEKILLTKLDSISAAHNIRIYKEFRFADLVGYRANAPNEHFRDFWIDEKGKTVDLPRHDGH